MKHINALKTIIEKQQSKITEKLVEKSDLTRLEMQTKKWTKDHFADQTTNNKHIMAINNKLANVEDFFSNAVAPNLDHNENFKKLKLDLENKANKLEVEKMKEHYQRFALYDDYRLLYEKVVPPCVTIQNNITEFNKEFEQLKLII